MNRSFILSAVFILSQSSFAQYGLVHDERGHVVTSSSGSCVMQEGADPTIAKTACDALLGRVKPVAVPPRTPEPIELNATFDTNRAALAPSDKEKISDAAKKTTGQHEIVIRGYTDYRGTDKLNQGLAERRAEAAKDVLVKSGVPERQIRVETQIPASTRAESPCAHLKGEKLGTCLRDDRKVEVQIRAR